MEQKSRLTTLCYIENKGAYLMLHRISKKNDVNKDKWIGVGGILKGREPGGLPAQGSEGGNRTHSHILAVQGAGHIHRGGLGYRVHVSVYCGQI